MKTFDLEVYQNFFLAVFKDYDSGSYEKYAIFDDDNISQQQEIVEAARGQVLIGHNSFNYDMPLIRILADKPNMTAYQMWCYSNMIITGTCADPSLTADLPDYRAWRGKEKDICQLHIDTAKLFKKDTDDYGSGVIPLKLLGINLNHKKLQELPFDPQCPIGRSQIRVLTDYCVNDVDITELVIKKNLDVLKVREFFRLNGIEDAYVMDEPAISEKWMVSYLKRTDPKFRDAVRQKSQTTGFFVNPPSKIYIKDIMLRDMSYKTEDFQKQYRLYSESVVNCFVNNGKLIKQLVSPHGRVDGFEVSDIYGKTYNLKLGGIHSNNDIGGWVENETHEIMYIDVSGYYPSLISHYKLKPEHTTGTIYPDYLGELKTKRAAIKESDPVQSDSLKLVANSNFGKTGSPYSPLFSLTMMYGTTVNGQLFLLSLVDDITHIGGYIINANTDGVCVWLPRNKRPEAEKILKDWQQLTGMKLDEESYTHWFQANVNNYFSKRDTGKIKEKGCFITKPELGKQLIPFIVNKALQRYHLEGVPFEDTIRECTDVTQFLYSFKASKKFNIFYRSSEGDVEAQNINRFYIGSDTSRHFVKFEKDKDCGRIAGTRGAVELNDLPDFFPEDIDYNHYIDECYRSSLQIMFGIKFDLKETVPAKAVYESTCKSAEVYNKYKDILPIVPRRWAKKAFPGFKNKEPETYWKLNSGETINPTTCPGFGVPTGSDFGIVSIDIDHPDKIPEKLLSILRDHPSLMVSHGRTNAEKILSGSSRGAILFKCKDAFLADTTGKKRDKKPFVESYGFEVLYRNGRIQTIHGAHNNGDLYETYGELAEISDELLHYLKTDMSLVSRKNQRSDDDFINVSVAVDDQMSLMQLIRQNLPQVLASDGFMYQETSSVEWSDKSLKLTLMETTDKFEPTVTVWVDDTGRANIHCYNETVTYDYKNALFRAVGLSNLAMLSSIEEEPEPTKPEAPPGNLPRSETFDNIAEVFSQALTGEGKVSLITAPPGSGKSTNLEIAVMNLLEKETPCFVVVPNKKILQQFVNSLCSRMGVTDVEDFDGTLVVMGNNRIPAGTKAVFTHFHYIKRRGFSRLSYSTMNWVKDNKPVVMIDECDQLVDSLSGITNLTGRYSHYTKTTGGESYYQHNICPSTASKSFRCNNCIYRGEVMVGEDEYHNPQIQSLRTVDLSQWEDKNSWKNLVSKTAVNQVFDVEEANETMRLNRLMYDQSWIDRRETITDPDTERFDIVSVLNDVISCSYNPTIITWDSTVNPDDLVERYENLLREGCTPEVATKMINDYMKEVDEDGERMRVYPHYCCGATRLVTTDAYPLRYLKNNCNCMILTTATMTKFQEEFLNYSIPELEWLDVTSSNFKPVDELLLITYPEPIDLTRDHKPVGKLYERLAKYTQAWLLTDGESTFNKTLVFKKTKSEASDITNTPIALYNSGDRVFVDEDLSNKEWTILESHSRGSIARGINLGEFGVCMIDARNYKPMYTYLFAANDQDTLEEKRMQDMDSTIAQAAGRIIRRDPEYAGKNRKVVIVHGCEERVSEIRKNLQKEFNTLVQTNIQYLEYEPAVIPYSAAVRLFRSAQSFMTEGEVCKFEEVLEKEFFSRPWSRLSRKEQEQFPEEKYNILRKGYLEMVRVSEIKSQAMMSAREGISWREFSRKHALNRLRPDDAKEIERVFVKAKKSQASL